MSSEFHTTKGTQEDMKEQKGFHNSMDVRLRLEVSPEKTRMSVLESNTSSEFLGLEYSQMKSREVHIIVISYLSLRIGTWKTKLRVGFWAEAVPPEQTSRGKKTFGQKPFSFKVTKMVLGSH